MSARVIDDGSGRDAWLLARQDYVSASDVASVLGFGGKSRARLLREKIARKDEGEDPGELAMVAAGRHLEPGVLSWFAAETLGTLSPNKALLGCACHPWLAATPDAILDGTIPVEAKNVMFESGYQWRVNSTQRKGWPAHHAFPVPIYVSLRGAPFNARVAKDDVGTARGAWRQACIDTRALLPSLGDFVAPGKYWCQNQVQQHIIGSDHGWITVAIGGGNRVDLCYAYDADFMTWALDECRVFWELVVEGRNK